jgi:hypothetical protein
MSNANMNRSRAISARCAQLHILFARCLGVGAGTKIHAALARIALGKFWEEFLRASAASWLPFCKRYGSLCFQNRSGLQLVNIGRNVMHAVMRDYSSGTGAKKLFDLLEKKKAEVKNVIMPIKGFVSYTLVRTDRGGVLGQHLPG